MPELQPVAGLLGTELPGGPALKVQQAPPSQIESAWSGATDANQPATAVVDGSVWSIQQGRAGDVRMDHQLARFHLGADGATLLCAPADEHDPAWRRLLLDTALVTASLTHGLDALHAGCVVKDGYAVAVAGASGAGKTTLMLELLRRGASFLTDDVLALVPAGAAVLGQPGPPVANLSASEDFELVAERLHLIGDEWWARIRQPHTTPVPVSAVVVLDRVTPGHSGPAVAAVKEPAAALLALGLQSGPSPQRRERRLEVLGHLAQAVEVIGLNVDGLTPARELAAQLIEAVPRLAP